MTTTLSFFGMLSSHRFFYRCRGSEHGLTQFDLAFVVLLGNANQTLLLIANVSGIHAPEAYVDDHQSIMPSALCPNQIFA
jgi:hypothetical protein